MGTKDGLAAKALAALVILLESGALSAASQRQQFQHKVGSTIETSHYPKSYPDYFILTVLALLILAICLESS